MQLQLRAIALLVSSITGLVYAQTASLPTTTAGSSPCIQQCVEQALPAGGCASSTDFTCICTSGPFQEAARSCLEANCTEDERATALGFQAQQCGAAGLTVTSGTASPTNVSSVLTNPSGSAPTSSGVLTNPSGTGSLSISTAPGLPSTGGSPSTTIPTGTSSTGSGGSTGGQSQTQNAAISTGGQLFYMHDIVAILVVWAGIVVGGAILL